MNTQADTATLAETAARMSAAGERLVAAVRHELGADPPAAYRAEAVRRAVDGYLDEVPTGISTLVRALAAHPLGVGARVLEIGSGAGLVVAAAAEAGVDICGVEPVGLGFDAVRVIGDDVLRRLGVTVPVVPSRVEDLATADVGQFDIIVSTYVLEHLVEPATALAVMAHHLRPGGVMVHLTPNYSVPYEPHFGLPYLWWAPALTRRIARRAIARDPDLWESITPVRWRSLRAVARRLGLTAALDRGVMAETLRRLTDDPGFAARHRRLAAHPRAVRAAAGVVARLPPRWGTPMRVVMRR